MAGEVVVLSEATWRRLEALLAADDRLPRPAGRGRVASPRQAPVDHVRVTGAISGNYYPAVLRELDAEAGTWSDVAGATVWAVDPSGAALAEDTVYLARRRGDYGGVPVYSTEQAGAGGGITLSEVDGTPSYTSITEIRVDQVDGFVLSEVSPGVARLDISDASLTTHGVVTISAQEFAGRKTFKDGGLSKEEWEVYGVVRVTPGDGVTDGEPFNVVEWNDSGSVTHGAGSDVWNSGLEVNIRAAWHHSDGFGSPVSRWCLGRTEIGLGFPGEAGGVAGFCMEFHDDDGETLRVCGSDGSSGPPRFGIWDEFSDVQYDGITDTLYDGTEVVGGIITSAGTGPTEIDGGTF